MSDGIKKVSENVIRPGRALTIISTSVSDTNAIPVGTLRTDINNQGLQFKQALGVWSKFKATEILLPGSITNELLAKPCVDEPNIFDNAVTTRIIRDYNVTTSKIADLNVTTEKIADQNVTTAKIKDLNVITEKLNDYAVTEIKIAENAVTTPKIMKSAVTETKIADGAVTTPKLRNLCVTNEKIANDTIENEKYKSQSIYGDKIQDQGIETVHIKDYNVTGRKLANGAVTTDKIADSAITSAKIAEKAIKERHLDDNAVSTRVIQDDAVDSNKLKESTVSINHLSPELANIIKDLQENTIRYDSEGNVKINKHDKSSLSVAWTIDATKVYNAVYKDLAEAYVPGELLEPGDIVEVREDGKVYRAKANSKTVVGVVSDEFATCFGCTEKDLKEGKYVPVGLIGVIHVKVVGPIKLGDKITIQGSGVGMAAKPGDVVIGKAISFNEAPTKDIKKVECLVFPS